MSIPGSSMSAAAASRCPSSPSSSPSMIKAIRRPCVLAAAMVHRASKALAASRHSVPRAMAIPSAFSASPCVTGRRECDGFGSSWFGWWNVGSLLVGFMTSQQGVDFFGARSWRKINHTPWIRPATSGLMGGGWVGGLSSSPGRRWTNVAPFHCSSPHVCNGPFRRSSKPCGGSGGEGMTKAKLVGWLGVLQQILPANQQKAEGTLS